MHFALNSILTSLGNYFGDAIVNITQVGNFTKVPYKYKLTDLYELPFTVLASAGVGKI